MNTYFEWLFDQCQSATDLAHGLRPEIKKKEEEAFVSRLLKTKCDKWLLIKLHSFWIRI
jgi:hypothetical protein